MFLEKSNYDDFDFIMVYIRFVFENIYKLVIVVRFVVGILYLVLRKSELSFKEVMFKICKISENGI